MKKQLCAGLLILLVAGPAMAQTAPPATPDKPEHKRVYLLFGLNQPDYDHLNTTLRGTTQPGLTGSATLLGFGFSAGPGLNGRFSLGAELRASLRQAQRKAERAYTRGRAVTVSLLAQYEVVRTERFALSVMAGPEFSTLDLTLKVGRPDGNQPRTFDDYLAAGPNKIQLIQYLYGATAAIQADWKFKPRISPNGLQRQTTLGVRVQYSAPFARSRWRTEDDNWLKADKLSRTPEVNPGGFAAGVVIGGLLGRP